MNNAHLKNLTLMDRLEQLLLRGETSPYRLALAFEMDVRDMSDLIKEVYKSWRQRRNEDLDEIRNLRIEQLQMIMRMALKDYEETRKPKTKVTEEIRPCGFCNGKGKDEVMPDEYVTCKKCNGSGKFKVTKIETVERDPNPQFLKLAQECVVNAAKFSGIGGQVTYNQINKLGEAIGGKTKEEVRMLQFKGAPDQILAALGAMDRIKQGLRKGEIEEVKPVITNPDEEEKDDK